MFTDNRITAQRRPRVVMVNTAISQPRHQRRARMLYEAGFDVRVYAYGRGYFPENTYPTGVEVVDLGIIKSGRYIRRLLALVNGALRIRSFEAREQRAPSIQYAFGLDAALMSSLAFGRSIPMIYEVGDIMVPLERKSLLSRFIHGFDTRIVRSATKLVLTAPAFLDQYFSQLCPQVEGKTVLIENKLTSEYVATTSRPVSFAPHEPLRLGFVGAFRYPDSLLPLVDAVVQRAADYELHLYGDGPLREELLRRSRHAKNVFYHGPFRNPGDLTTIYQSIDVSYVVYDNKDQNVRMALPNKLYEAIFFGRPIVVAAKTDLARRVEELGIGFVVDPREPGFVESFLDNLSIGDVRTVGERALTLPETLAVHDDERIVEQLLDGI